MDEQHKQELLEKLSKAMPGTLYIKAGWSENSDGTMPRLTGSLSFEDGRVSLLDKDGWETAEMDAGFVVSVGSEGIRIVGVGYPVTGRRAYQEWLFVPGSDTAGEG